MIGLQPRRRARRDADQVLVVASRPLGVVNEPQHLTGLSVHVW